MECRVFPPGTPSGFKIRVSGRLYCRAGWRALKHWFIVLNPDAEQCGLFCGVFTHLPQLFGLIQHHAARFLVFPLGLALVLVPLFLLARLLFLTFGKG